MLAPTSMAPVIGSPTTAGFTTSVHGDSGTQVVSSHKATNGIDGSAWRTTGKGAPVEALYLDFVHLAGRAHRRQDDVDELPWLGRCFGLVRLDFRFDVVADIGAVGISERKGFR